jgi:cellulose synthase/poly-beta-1,6-N-acetylglucosamine synthase-like glycosyltransferase
LSDWAGGWAVTILFWLFAGPAVALALFSLRGERARGRYVARRLAEQAAELPPATLMVPVKGPDEGLRENLAALAALDYPDYELIVVADSAADSPPGVLPRRVKVVLAHATDARTCEKVRNLLAAVRAARKRSEVLVFADSDGRVTRGWLRALVAPLSEDGVGAVTGYRWFLPARGGFWPLVRAVWDAVAAGTLGPGDNAFAWGGAAAIRKETFFQVRVPEYWQDALTDDFTLARAVHAAGLTIAFAPGALTPCVDHTTAGGFLEWSRRQMTLTRLYAPRLWWSGLIAHVFYCGGMVAAVAAFGAGHHGAAWVLIAQLAPGMVKGLNRAMAARAALPEYGEWFRRWTWVHAVGVPLGTWLWLLALVASGFVRTMEWRGRRYEVRGAGK